MIRTVRFRTLVFSSYILSNCCPDIYTNWHGNCSFSFMQLNSAKNKTNKTKTLLLIIGVIIAVLLIFYADIFSGNESSFYQYLNTPVNNSVTENIRSNSVVIGSGYNSVPKLFELFTKNLPFLNSK
ncbi:MAG: hypothetical protein ACJA0X_002423 [Cyclobacteriaceae bacterium]|jgi:hypothetical protein